MPSKSPRSFAVLLSHASSSSTKIKVKKKKNQKKKILNQEK